MKPVVILVFTLLLSGCEKEKTTTGAREYMFSISHDMYQSFYLPELGPDAIPELLTYRTNHNIIQHYPANPISSFRGDSITVAHIALWTIESIRISWLKGDQDPFSRYPSLNPIVVDTTFIMRDSFAVLDSVADRYYHWWTDGTPSIEERLSMDPLAQSTFRWR